MKSNVRKRPYDAGGLGRQGAVRKRKESIHEQNGHKFVVKQFYTVVLCALCGEFLLKGAGMQCEDCKYACHKNCYQKVVTKCISKSNTDAVRFLCPSVSLSDSKDHSHSPQTCRTRTKNKSIIVFLIDSNLSPISRPIGVVTAVSFFPLVENKLESVQVRCH